MFFIQLRGPVIRSYVRKILECSHAIIVDHTFMKRKVLSYIKDEEKVFCVPIGVDASLFYRDEGKRQRMRSNLGLKDDELLVICTRWHRTVYGIENIIRAIPLITSKIKNARFLFVGSGPLLSHHQRLTKALGVSAYVTFIPTVPNDIMPEFFSAADLYVSASYSDGPSVSMLESMACELPVVVTDLPAIREWAIQGVLVKRSDPELIANAIIDTLTLSLDEREEIGRRNRSIITERIEMRKTITPLVEVYKYAISKASIT
jgi:glycosyltransferase involved in cell wall biosynthesis